MRIIPVLTALACWAISVPAQQAPKQTNSAAKPAKETCFPACEEKDARHGLRVVVIEQHENPSLSLQLLFPGGTRSTRQPARQAWRTPTAALIREGTAPARRSRSRRRRLGGASSTRSRAGVRLCHGARTSDQLDLGLASLRTWSCGQLSGRGAGALAQPDAERSQIHRATPITSRTPPSNGSSRAAIPMGLPAGTPESVKGLTRDDLVAYHKRQYGRTLRSWRSSATSRRRRIRQGERLFGGCEGRGAGHSSVKPRGEAADRDRGQA